MHNKLENLEVFYLIYTAMKQFGYSQNVVHLLKNRESGKCFDTKGTQYFSFALCHVNTDYKYNIIGI